MKLRLRGGDTIDPQLQRRDVQSLLQSLRSKERAVPRTLRLKNYISSDVNTQVIDNVLNALIDNEFVEALYIHNFEQGMTDDQIDLLIKVLEKGRIWILNVGENFQVSRDGWERLSEALKRTNVTHIYVSEHIITKDMKKRIIKSVRCNRAKDRRHLDYGRFEMINKIGQMWWNPRLRLDHVLARHTDGCWRCWSGIQCPNNPIVRCSNTNCDVQMHRYCLSLSDDEDVDIAMWQCDRCEKHRDVKKRKTNLDLERETRPEKMCMLRNRYDMRGRLIIVYDGTDDWIGRIIRRWKFRKEKKERWEIWYNHVTQDKMYLDCDVKYAVFTDFAWMKISRNHSDSDKTKNEMWWPVTIFSFSDASTEERKKEKSGMRYLRRLGLDGEVFSWVKISTEKDSLNSLRPFCFDLDTVKQVTHMLYGKNEDVFNTHYMDHVGNLGTYNPQGIFKKRRVWKHVIERHHKEESKLVRKASWQKEWIYALKMAYVEEALVHALRTSHPTKTSKISAEESVKRCWRCGLDSGKHTNDCKEEKIREEIREKEENKKREMQEKKEREIREKKKKEREIREKKKKKEEEEIRQKKEKKMLMEEKRILENRVAEIKWSDGEDVCWKRQGRGNNPKRGFFCFGTLLPEEETESCVVVKARNKNKISLIKEYEGFRWHRKPSRFAAKKTSRSFVGKVKDDESIRSYVETMKEPKIVSKTRKGRNIRQVNRFCPVFCGGSNWFAAQNEHVQKNYNVLTSSVNQKDHNDDVKERGKDLKRRRCTSRKQEEGSDDDPGKLFDDVNIDTSKIDYISKDSKMKKKKKKKDDSILSKVSSYSGQSPKIVATSRRGRAIKQRTYFCPTFNGGLKWYEAQKDHQRKKIELINKSTSKSNCFNTRDMISVPKNYDLHASDVTQSDAKKSFASNSKNQSFSVMDMTVVVKIHFLDPQTGLIDKKRTTLSQILDMSGKIATFKQNTQHQLSGSECLSKYSLFKMSTHSNPIYGQDGKTHCCQRLSDETATKEIVMGIDFLPHLLFCPLLPQRTPKVVTTLFTERTKEIDTDKNKESTFSRNRCSFPKLKRRRT